MASSQLRVCGGGVRQIGPHPKLYQIIRKLRIRHERRNKRKKGTTESVEDAMWPDYCQQPRALLGLTSTGWIAPALLAAFAGSGRPLPAADMSFQMLAAA